MTRKTDFKEEYCQLLIDHMSKGLSFESFGAVVGAGRSTLYLWRDHNKSFMDAHELGKQAALGFFEKVGVQGLLGKIKGFNASVWMFYMKNRFGWTDRQEVTATVEAGSVHAALVDLIADFNKNPNAAEQNIRH